ncbi:MAG: ACT domain-containing protein [Thermodesulfobacteriota bacterium]|nr:ACT domain-containing protein [Thermodesulfobacteriota bacterium]
MKTVKQINLWLKNQPGILSQVSELLGANGINIIAFYVITEKDEGRLHFVANDPDKAVNVLKTGGYRVEVDDVIACETPHHPGGMDAVLKPLKLADINVDYIYPCIGTGGITVLILGLGPIEEAVRLLEDNWIRVLDDELYHI